MATNVVMIRRNLYSLKREYGFPLDIYRIQTAVANLQTGHKQTTKKKYHVGKAIILPTLLARKMMHNASYGGANGQFSYGGAFDIESRIIAIDYRDLPKSILPLVTTDLVVYDHKLYDVKSADEFEHKQAVLLTLERSKGTLPEEEISVTAFSRLAFNQSLARTQDANLTLTAASGFTAN